MIKSRCALGLAALASAVFLFAADDSITLVAGRELHVQFITELSSKVNETGDLWEGKVVEPIFGQGREIVPDGSTVEGHIKFVNSPEHAKGKSKEKERGDFLLIADSISTPDGAKYNIVASPQAAQGRETQAQETGGLTALASSFSKKGKTLSFPREPK